MIIPKNIRKGYQIDLIKQKANTLYLKVTSLEKFMKGPISKFHGTVLIIPDNKLYLFYSKNKII